MDQGRTGQSPLRTPIRADIAIAVTSPFELRLPSEKILEVSANRQWDAWMDYEVRACRGFAWQA